MGSTFGKVRKYSLNPTDESPTPLKYSSVPENHVEPPASSTQRQTKDPLHKHIPEPKQTIQAAEAPFNETTPNYGQYLPNHLRVNVDGMFIPRTKSTTGHLFDKKSLKGADSSFKGPPRAQSSLDSSTEQRLKPEQKYYSADELDKLLQQMRTGSTQEDLRRRDPISHDTLKSLRSEPCKYCKGFNPSEYRGQYIYEPDPPPYRPTTATNSPLGEFIPSGYTPTGKHYHLIEVHPQPYFSSSDPRPLHDYGQYNMWKDPERPNLIKDRNESGVINQNRNTDKVQTGNQDRSNGRVPPSHQTPDFRNGHNPVKNSSRINHNPMPGSSVLGQPLMSNDFKTRSLPHRGSPYPGIYTIPEENITWPPPLHRGQSFHQVNRGGFRK